MRVGYPDEFLSGVQSAGWLDIDLLKKKKKTKLRGFSPQANYTDQATAACRRS
jgi:hypothetical protein